jgi:hypothetical protein
MIRREPRDASGATRHEGIGRLPYCVFRREGEYWTVVYEGEVVRLRDAKGLRYLAHLLGCPGEGVAASHLLSPPVTPGSTPEHRGGPLAEGIAPGHGSDDTSELERARLSVTKRIKAAIERIAELHPRLGHHLAASVKTGRRCVYTPPPGERIWWEH